MLQEWIAAKKRGIVTAASILSWENSFTKDRMPIILDRDAMVP